MSSNKSNSKPSTRNGAASNQNTQNTANNPPPSVPISVYRELAAELQTARVMLDSLHTQNQKLVKQNQHLRLEIERVVQSALHLRHVADSLQSGNRNTAAESSHPISEAVVETIPSIPSSRSVPRTIPAKTELPEAAGPSEVLFTEQGENRHRHNQQAERTSDLGGWWLAIVILLIVVSAFGAGFLIVRPFLPTR